MMKRISAIEECFDMDENITLIQIVPETDVWDV